MARTKLVELVVNLKWKSIEHLDNKNSKADLVKNEWFVIVSRVILNNVIDSSWLKNIHNLYSIKIDHDPSTGTTGNIFDLIRLESCLNISHRSQEWNHHVEPRACHSLQGR